MGEKNNSIIHIAFDSIFLDYTIEQFETVAPNQSSYLIDIPYNDYKIKYIKNIDKIFCINFSSLGNRNQFLSELKIGDILIFHCLNGNMVNIINKTPIHIKLVWFVWGGEVSSLPLLNKNLYQPLTLKFLNQLRGFPLKNLFYKKFPKIQYLLYKIKKGELNPTLQKIKAIRRINYAGIFVKQDFDLFNSAYNFNLNWQWYSYYSINESNNNATNIAYTEKENILIGNSANPTNNHLDIFNVLKSFDLRGTKTNVICPLSYGTELKEYIEMVINEGGIIFGKNFVPLINFIDDNQYNKIISSCKVVIMNHNRQQAIGNIVKSIWIGARVFLNECNPLYNYFTTIGVKVFSIQKDLSADKNSSFFPLEPEIIKENRDKLFKNLSHEMVLEKTRQMIKTLTDIKS